MVLAVDLLRYALHRACHRYPLLWRLHEVHHSPEILYALNVGRFHPIEKALHFMLDTVPFLIFGVAPEVIAGYFLLYSVNGFFQHSNLRLRYGWLNYLVGSAETHRWQASRTAFVGESGRPRIEFTVGNQVAVILHQWPIDWGARSRW